MPVDESKLQKDIGRAARAKALLENELLSEAFATLEQSYTDAWRSTHVEATPAREKLFLAVNIVGKVRDHLGRVMADGVMAQKQIDEIARLGERRKLFGVV